MLLAAALVTGLSRASCSPGEYTGTVAVFGSATCLPCAKGQYSDSDGSVSCKNCPVGKFTTGWASSKCNSCPEGQLSLYIDMDVCVDPTRYANSSASTDGGSGGDSSSDAGGSSGNGLVDEMLYRSTHRIEQFSMTKKLGESPFILPREEGPDSWDNPGNVQASIGACQQQCMELKSCLYGTYITDGDRKGECWLAAQTKLPLTTSDLCGVPCISFRKVASSSGEVVPYQSAHMLAEQQTSEADQLDGISSSLAHVHGNASSESDGVKSLIATLHSEQHEMEAQMASQKRMLAMMKQEQEAMRKTMQTQLDALHAGHAQMNNKLSGHHITLQGLVTSQEQMQHMLEAAEQRIVALARNIGPLNYTALEVAIDEHRALLNPDASQDAQSSIDSAASLALALDQAHLHAVEKAGGFEHFKQAGLVCPSPPIPTEGYTLAFSQSDRVVGGKVRFACKFGWALVGSAVRQCIHHDDAPHWSGEPTFCEAITNAPTGVPTPIPTVAPTPPPTPAPRCGRPPQPLNMLVSGVSTTHNSFPMGTEVFYHCMASFQMVGRASSECTAIGWTSPPLCANNVHTCSHTTCRLRLTHEKRPGFPGYHLQTQHHKMERHGTKHKCAYEGNTHTPNPDLTDCTCICWDTGLTPAVVVT